VRHLLGPITDFPENDVQIHIIDGQEIGIYNVDGQFYAVRNYCPHRGAPLCLGQHSGTMLPSDPGNYHYGLDKKVLRCPWHQWEFNLEDGQALFGTTQGRVRTYPTTITNGQLFLETSRRAV